MSDERHESESVIGLSTVSAAENHGALVATKHVRSSNLEFMRIFLMLLIIAHHFVVNSGVTVLWSSGALTPSGAFLTLWGMWGKVAINAFVMVTGWFMCRSRLTWKRYIRLLAQIYFWKLVV